MLYSGYLKLQSVRASSIRAAIAKMARVIWWRLIDVINVEIATVTHLNVDGPKAALSVGEAYLPSDFTFVHCGMSTVQPARGVSTTAIELNA